MPVTGGSKHVDGKDADAVGAWSAHDVAQAPISFECASRHACGVDPLHVPATGKRIGELPLRKHIEFV